MRTFTQRDRKIIEIILEQNISNENVSPGGELFFKNGFFPEEDSLLLVPDLRYACYLFNSKYNSTDIAEYIKSYDGKIKQLLRDTIDSIALLDYLEEKGMIYVYERTGKFRNLALFFGNVQNKFARYVHMAGYYSCPLMDKTLTFHINNRNEIALKEQDGRITKHGYDIKEENTCNKMFHFFNGCIYATSALEELRNNKYKTDEEIALDEAKEQTKLARKTFKWSIFAIAVSIIMPIILNKSCTSDVRIEEKQFNSLIKDSVISEKVDSSLYYIKKISAQSAEAQKTAKQDSVKNTKSGKEQKKKH